MSITLITGVPGSGKTLKAVWDHVRPMVGHVDKSVDEWGRTVEVPSVIYTNINSLQVDHELIEGGGSWKQNPDKSWVYEGNPQGLRNWPAWAKPGAKIVFDEFQKHWPPRPNGSAIPPDIQTLDTHRHMGVDFILITQNCRNVDRHILGLVDRHLHVRRVANMPLATVYEWDHASVTLQYKNSISKSPFRYPKAAYKLYKSAELHTKQARKLPAVLWFILAGLAGAAYAIPQTINRISHKQVAQAPEADSNKKTFVNEHGQRVTVETSTVSPSPIAAASAPAESASAPVFPSAVGASGLPGQDVAGCISVGSRCSCFTPQGVKVPKPAEFCSENSATDSAIPKQVQPDTPMAGPVSVADRDALAFLRRSRSGVPL